MLFSASALLHCRPYLVCVSGGEGGGAGLIVGRMLRLVAAWVSAHMQKHVAQLVLYGCLWKVGCS
jgi:hypothetical protein